MESTKEVEFGWVGMIPVSVSGQVKWTRNTCDSKSVLSSAQVAAIYLLTLTHIDRSLTHFNHLHAHSILTISPKVGLQKKSKSAAAGTQVFLPAALIQATNSYIIFLSAS